MKLMQFATSTAVFPLALCLQVSAQETQHTDMIAVGEPERYSKTRSFVELDIDGDDIIDRDEAIEGRIDRDFEQMDLNNNKEIDRQEYREFEQLQGNSQLDSTGENRRGSNSQSGAQSNPQDMQRNSGGQR